MYQERLKYINRFVRSGLAALAIATTMLVPAPAVNAQEQNLNDDNGTCITEQFVRVTDASNFELRGIQGTQQNTVIGVTTNDGAASATYDATSPGDWQPDTITSAYVDVKLATDNRGNGNRTITITADGNLIYSTTSDAIATFPNKEVAVTAPLPDNLKTKNLEIGIAVSGENATTLKEDVVAVEGPIEISRCGNPKKYNDETDDVRLHMGVIDATIAAAAVTSDYCGTIIDPETQLEQAQQQQPLPAGDWKLYAPYASSRQCKNLPPGMYLQQSLPDASGSYQVIAPLSTDQVLASKTTGTETEIQTNKPITLTYSIYDKPPHHTELTPPSLFMEFGRNNQPTLDNSPATLADLKTAQKIEQLILDQRARLERGDKLRTYSYPINALLYSQPSSLSINTTWLTLFNAKACGSNIDEQRRILREGGVIQVTPTGVAYEIVGTRLKTWLFLQIDDFESCPDIVLFPYADTNISLQIFNEQPDAQVLAERAKRAGTDYPVQKIVVRPDNGSPREVTGADMEIWVPAATAAALGGAGVAIMGLNSMSGGGGSAMLMLTPQVTTADSSGRAFPKLSDTGTAQR